MNKKTVITIGRQFGSGGRQVGRRIADELGVPFYDKELLAHAARESGMAKELFENYDEAPTNSLLYSLSMGAYSMGNLNAAAFNLPLNHKVFLAQFDAIKKLAEQGGCVIVGRCADYALANYPHLVNVFIYADIKKRAARVAEYEGIPLKEAEERALKTDKKRASYYNFYSNKKWGAVESYHLSVDSGAINLDNTARLILDFAQMKDPV